MQNNTLVTILICGLFTLGCSLCAFAAPESSRLARLKSADTNGDNKVSVEEFEAAFPRAERSAFKAHDKNNDGFLSLKDFQKEQARGTAPAGEPKARMMALLRQADVNGNREVTFKEISAVVPALSREHFARFDRNGDGVISEADRQARTPEKGDRRALLAEADKDNNKKITFEELKAEVPELTKQRFARFDRNEDGILSEADRSAGAREGAADRRPPRAAIARIALQADTNGDKKVTFEEMTAVKPGFPRARFDQLDMNGDGVLSRDDMQKGHKRKQ